MSKELGKRISESLKKSNTQQKELAERIGITEAVMSRYISGDREPKPETLANIATALNTTSDYLLGIENDEFDYPRVRRIIARNASAMTDEEKKALINALFGEE
ncbi:MAG: helix-turn-helix transcriptional regulator [Christensenellaceae bacterium]